MLLTIQNLTDQKLVFNSILSNVGPAATKTFELTIAEVERLRPALLRMQANGQILFSSDQSSETAQQEEVEGALVSQLCDTCGGGGGGGGGASYYQHDQPIPALTWVISHNLGYYPGVDAFTVGGFLMEVEVMHLNTNVTQVIFKVPTAGFAHVV